MQQLVYVPVGETVMFKKKKTQQKSVYSQVQGQKYITRVSLEIWAVLLFVSVWIS